MVNNLLLEFPGVEFEGHRGFEEGAAVVLPFRRLGLLEELKMANKLSKSLQEVGELKKMTSGKPAQVMNSSGK